MKIFLDLSTKTVQIIDGIGFDELDELKKFLGDDYKSWKIEPTAEPLTIRVKDNQQYPGIFPTPTTPYQPFQPYYQQPAIMGHGSAGTGTGSSTTITTGGAGYNNGNNGYASGFNNCGTYTSNVLDEVGQN